MSFQDDIHYVNATTAKYRFDEMNDEANIYLQKHGYVVIKNILDIKQITTARNLLWEFLNRIGWDKNYYQTWRFGENEGESSIGIFRGHGISQSKLQWYIRKNKKVINTFAKLWNVKSNELITAFESCVLFRPWYIDESTMYWKTSSSWYHIDQNVKRKPQFECIQAYVTLYDQNEYTGSTVVIPNSHLLTQKNLNLKISPFEDADFIYIPKDNILLNMEKILICSKPGDMILWDSRTVHCNSPSLKTVKEMQKHYGQKQIVIETNSNKQLNILNELLDIFEDKKEDEINKIDLLRAVCLVCMTPKCKANKSVLVQRINGYINQYALSHWPHEFVVLHRPEMNTFPNYLKKKSVLDLDEEQKILTGITDELLSECSEYNDFYYLE
eukprot:211116_1